VKGRVLVVEDEAKIAAVIVDYLHAAGFETSHVSNGIAALAECDRQTIDVVSLDLNVPGLDGLEVCRALRRSRHTDIGIIMVTARVDEVERLLGLEIGADDYLCKPFSPRELVARVQSLMRRRARLPNSERSVDPRDNELVVDETSQRAMWKGQLLPLTPIEWRLLHALYTNEGRVMNRSQLLDAVQTDFRAVSDRAVDSHIKNLRKKLASAAPDHEFIASIYGLGYRFALPSGASS
jgi:two-component system, OmpR family, response regulator BaeR